MVSVNVQGLKRQVSFNSVATFVMGISVVFASGSVLALSADAEDVTESASQSVTEKLAAGAITLVVKPVVEIEASRADITLGDLVSNDRMSATARDELRSVRLADAPNAGESRAFTESGLIETFRPVLLSIEMKTGESFSLRVPSRVTISKRKMRVKSADVERELISQLKSVCAECEFEISGLVVPSIKSRASEGGEEWKLRVRPELPKGGFSVPLEVSDMTGMKRTYWVSGQVVVRRNVPVLARSINMGERIQPEDFTMQLKDVTFATDTPAVAPELSASLAARQLSAGQILWRSNLRREMAVRSGEAVKVSAGTEGWQISIDGVAQNSGYIGDLIRVKIPRTQKIVSGFMTEKGLVEVR